MIFALVVVAFGVLFCWFAILGWRHRSQESISLLEAAILKATGQEPLPLTTFDRWLHRFQLVMMTLFGPTLVVIGASGLVFELGLL